MEELTLEKFEEASEIVSRVTLETKLKYSEYFSNQTGNKVYFKPENMQYTGAYKVRGAYYKISQLSKEEKERGVIACSAGNHAQGVAHQDDLAVTVVHNGGGGVVVSSHEGELTALVLVLLEIQNCHLFLVAH